MKKLLLLLLIVPMISFGQNISKLEELNGFRELKLGSDIREYNFVEKANPQNTSYYYTRFGFKSVEFKESIKDYRADGSVNSDTKLFVIKKGTPNYQVMPAGDKIEKVFINTFENKIFSIKIVVHHIYASDNLLLKSYRDVFGNPNFIDGLITNFSEGVSKSNRYTDYWSGKNISLHILALNGSKNFLGTKRRFYWVIYNDREITGILYDREKKRESIKKQKLIDDF